MDNAYGKYRRVDAALPQTSSNGHGSVSPRSYVQPNNSRQNGGSATAETARQLATVSSISGVDLEKFLIPLAKHDFELLSFSWQEAESLKALMPCLPCAHTYAGRRDFCVADFSWNGEIWRKDPTLDFSDEEKDNFGAKLVETDEKHPPIKVKYGRTVAVFSGSDESTPYGSDVTNSTTMELHLTSQEREKVFWGYLILTFSCPRPRGMTELGYWQNGRVNPNGGDDEETSSEEEEEEEETILVETQDGESYLARLLSQRAALLEAELLALLHARRNGM